MGLSFRPIDLESGLSDAIRFRRDSFVCSFGDASRFDEAEYIHYLKVKVAQDPKLAVHAFLDGALAGPMEFGVSRAEPWVGYINVYYLRPELRGRGLAVLLDAHAVAFLSARGHASARLSVSPSNLRAVRFYERNGWTPHGSRPVVSEPAPSAPVVQLLQKRLVPAVLEVPTLTTARLFLRALSKLDIPAIERHFIDYEVIRTLARSVPWPYPEGGVAAHLRRLAEGASADQWSWGLFLKQAPLECIGTIDLFRPGKPENRGFWLGRPFWGQGLMTEAAAAVNDHAFDVLGFEELTFDNALGNPRSRRVKEKTGARLVGVVPAEYVDPTLRERELWSLTQRAWRDFRAAR